MKKISLLLAILMTLSAFLTCVPTALANGDVTPSDVKDGIAYGDVNKDGSVTSSDALTCLQASVSKIALKYDGLTLADVNFDGTVTSSDALAILQMSVKKIDDFDGKTHTDQVYDIPDTEVENEAYTPDTSADLSFVMDNTGLDANTVYYVAFKAESAPDVEGYAMLYTFQGLVNRDFGRDANHTSLIFFNGSDTDPYWYDYVTSDGKSFEGINKKTITTAEEFYSIFEAQLKQCGYILWDPNVPATSNVALTICGVDGYLPVMAGSDLETLVKELGMEEKMSLVGLFQKGAETIPNSSTKSTGSTKNDAYIWALEKYFSRCSDSYLAYTADGAQRVSTNPISTSPQAKDTCSENYDYFVARRAFVFDLYPYWKDAPIDDLDQPLGTDRETMTKIFDARYKRANGKFGQALGFPPHWVKYSSDNKLGDGTPGGSKDGVWIEWLYSETVACYNLAKEADAYYPPSMTNGSFYYKYRVPTDVELVNTEPWGDVYYKTDTHYFTIYLGDYDSAAWMKQYVCYHWMRSDRTQYEIPFMWAYNPNLSYRIPMAFDYIYSERTDYDYFTAGDSGAGYIIPAGLKAGAILGYAGDKGRPAHYGDGFDAWAEYCKTFYDRFDIGITGFILTGNNHLTKEAMECYTKFSSVGSFVLDLGQRPTTYNGVPFIPLYTQITPYTDPYDIYSYAFAVDKRNNDINYSAYRTVCLSPSQISLMVQNITAYCEGRGKDIEYVDPYTLFEMAEKSGSLIRAEDYN